MEFGTKLYILRGIIKLAKILLREGKRGRKDTKINLREGLSEREKQSQIACLKHQYRKVTIIHEN